MQNYSVDIRAKREREEAAALVFAMKFPHLWPMKDKICPIVLLWQKHSETSVNEIVQVQNFLI